MFIYRFVAGVIAAAALTWASPGSAGWVIDETVKGGAGGRQQVMMQANRIKSVVFEGGKPVSAFVVDLDAQTLTQADYKERYYFTATVQEYVQTFRGAMSGVMKEMQEALKGMSAEDRKVMEQMMPQQTQPDCREPRTELRKTGQQTTVAGYPATRSISWRTARPPRNSGSPRALRHGGNWTAKSSSGSWPRWPNSQAAPAKGAESLPARINPGSSRARAIRSEPWNEGAAR